MLTRVKIIKNLKVKSNKKSEIISKKPTQQLSVLPIWQSDRPKLVVLSRFFNLFSPKKSGQRLELSNQNIILPTLAICNINC